MPRRKPQSAKQHKAKLQEQRAIKRGDIPAPPPKENKTNRKRVRIRPERSEALRTAAFETKTAARRLQSSFLQISPEYLAFTKNLAIVSVLLRPIPIIARKLPKQVYEAPEGLSCPKRPKWRYTMSKKEVEANEATAYAKWDEETAAKVDEFKSNLQAAEAEEGAPDVPKSPMYYERNIEVWRQLWRVTELSSILLVLLDARCPPLHFPPSLSSYIFSLRPARQIILVLTKIDLVPESCAHAWEEWLKEHYADVSVVCVESYRTKEAGERKGQGSRKHFEPYLPLTHLEDLIAALKEAHQRLITPPPKIQADPAKAAAWKPRVRPKVDWDEVRMSITGGHAYIAPLDNPLKFDEGGEGDEEGAEDRAATEPLTIGLIGQPNVGKSSLLNAIFGTPKVKASKTPGKTKHFQTLFWTPEIRFVDCPGLVLPNCVPLELQVLSSILPISQVPIVPSCIHYISKLIPLESILSLEHPSSFDASPPVILQKTYRETRPQVQPTTPAAPQWTAMDILTSYAVKKGWRTAQAGRPDVHRAGNAILRQVSEGKLKWCFWPNGKEGLDGKYEGNGIWVKSEIRDEEDDGSVYSYSDDGTTDEDSEDSDDSESTDEEEEESGSGEAGESEEDAPVVQTAGRFGALSMLGSGD